MTPSAGQHARLSTVFLPPAGALDPRILAIYTSPKTQLTVVYTSTPHPTRMLPLYLLITVSKITVNYENFDKFWNTSKADIQPLNVCMYN